MAVTGVTVFVSPPSQTVNVGVNAAVEIRLDTNGIDVGSCQGRLSYDTSRLSFVTGQADQATWPFFQTLSESAGVIQFGVSRQLNTPVNGSNVLIASLQLSTDAGGLAALTFLTTAPQVLCTAGDLTTPLTTGVTNGSVTVSVPTATATVTEIPPTDTPTGVPTATATVTEIPPTDTPTGVPTATATVTEIPPTDTPTSVPTATATAVPTDTPTSVPTATDTAVPTDTPTSVPTATATAAPTDTPTSVPTATATAAPTDTPTSVPTATATAVPTDTPTSVPTATATAAPTDTPTLADDDGDGVPNVVEDGAPGGDGNDDGTQDRLQSDITSLPDVSGSRMMTLITSGGCAVNREVMASAPVAPDAGFAYRFGLLSFRLPCTQADVEILYHALSTWPAATVYRKYGPMPPTFGAAAYYDMPGVSFGTRLVGTVVVARVTFHLADGALGDGTATDGMIVDPGGPALYGTQPVPALSRSGLALMLLVLLIAGAIGIGRYRLPGRGMDDGIGRGPRTGGRR